MEGPHSEKIKTYFNQHASDWNEYYRASPMLINMVLIRRKEIGFGFVRKFSPAGGSVLDVGCGAGILSLELAEAGYTVSGVDIAPEMIELAEGNRAARAVDAARCNFRTGDVFSEEHTPGVFDIIVGMGFLQYQEDETVALQKLHGMLKPGGLLVLSGPVHFGLSNYFGLAARLRKRKLPDSPQIKLLREISRQGYSVPRFKSLLKTANFNWLTYQGHGFTNFEFIAPRVGLRGQRALHKFLTALAKVLPIQRYANDLVVAARKPA